MRCLPGLQSITPWRVSLLWGWFCPLPVDIRTAGGSPGGSGKLCLFGSVWLSREERWHEAKKNKERVNKEQL